MKKIKVLLTAIVITALSAACSSDDGGSAISGDVNGKWNPVKSVIKVGTSTFTEPYEENEPGCDKDYVEFANAGVLNNVIYFKNASNVCTPDSADATSWSRTDNTLTITGGEYDGTYEITKLNNSQLQIKGTSSTGGVTSTITVYLTKAAQ